MNPYLKIYCAAVATAGLAVGIYYDRKSKKNKAVCNAMLLAETIVKMKIYNGDYLGADITPEEDWEFFKMVILYKD